MKGAAFFAADLLGTTRIEWSRKRRGTLRLYYGLRVGNGRDHGTR